MWSIRQKTFFLSKIDQNEAMFLLKSNFCLINACTLLWVLLVLPTKHFFLVVFTSTRKKKKVHYYHDDCS
jgi:hypothetical protein